MGNEATGGIAIVLALAIYIFILWILGTFRQ